MERRSSRRSRPMEKPDTDTITVVLSDDHAVLRSGLRALLDAEPDIEVVGEAGDGEAAIELVRSLRPTVVVMDLSMPGKGGRGSPRGGGGGGGRGGGVGGRGAGAARAGADEAPRRPFLARGEPPLSG